jgi:hypothetical protein
MYQVNFNNIFYKFPTLKPVNIYINKIINNDKKIKLTRFLFRNNNKVIINFDDKQIIITKL